MSLIPEPIQEGKRCFVYCGDDRCNCGAGRRTPFSFDKPPQEWMRFTLEIIAKGMVDDPRRIAQQCLDHIKKDI